MRGQVLAVSRGLGDFGLKPLTTAVPHVKSVTLSEQHASLVLASDGYASRSPSPPSPTPSPEFRVLSLSPHARAHTHTHSEDVLLLGVQGGWVAFVATRMMKDGHGVDGSTRRGRVRADWSGLRVELVSR